MTTIYDYFVKVKAQKQINKLVKKYKNERVVIYGAGEYFKVLYENFDLSKLNIVGISDKKFEVSKKENFTNYTAIEPQELKEYDYDRILVALYDDVSLCDFLKYELLINTQNENKPIESIIQPTFWYAVKILLGK